ncbi:hypothetical protein NC99_36040 [Sunxiuqinia dokdonensis]|uniref:Uncharacterized protein n=1 Tax=Sunxiuqinia dokdonensis TaxID=1409788 RepID=A0A0L8V4V2_9BACT|nr:hypothetical protein NC99_36040 [Sunxiuqinia dokdonensis]
MSQVSAPKIKCGTTTFGDGAFWLAIWFIYLWIRSSTF